MEELKAISFTSEIFGEIRFIDVEGKPYAVGNDIASALGYARPRKAINDHCKGVLKKSYPTNGGEQVLNIIPESDIYRLVMKSRLPQAEAFESWIMEEVIPQIRMTGGYIQVKQEESDLEILSKAFVIAQRTITNFESLIAQRDKTIKKQENIIQQQSKDVDYLHRVINPPKLISTTDIAKDLGMTANKLHKALHLRGYIYKNEKDKCWKFYCNHQHMVPEFADYQINEFTQNLKWTEKGRRFIVELMDNDVQMQEILKEIDKQREESKNKKKTKKA